MELTSEQQVRLRGTYFVRCVKAGGYTMEKFGQYVWSEGEEMDLLDPSTPENLRAADFWIARNMCEDSGLELAQRIAAGDFVVGPILQPDQLLLLRIQNRG